MPKTKLCIFPISLDLFLLSFADPYDVTYRMAKNVYLGYWLIALTALGPLLRSQFLDPPFRGVLSQISLSFFFNSLNFFRRKNRIIFRHMHFYILITSEIQPSRDGAGTIQAQSHHRHSGLVLAGIQVSSWNCPLADVPFLCVPKEKEPKERAAVHWPRSAGTRPAPLGSLRAWPRPGAAELGPRTGPQTVLALLRPRLRREGCVKWRSQKHPAAPRWLKISGNQILYCIVCSVFRYRFITFIVVPSLIGWFLY